MMNLIVYTHLKTAMKHFYPRPFFSTLFFVLISFALMGCATMKKEECLTANWYEIGYEDGIKGYEPGRISDHRKACAEYGVGPDFTLYQQGRKNGLVEFCTPNKGFVLGRKGRAFKDICPEALKPGFIQGYRQGRQIHEFEQSIHHQKKSWIA
ncbi:MAG: DUF2799 domain-containing protein [Desulfobacter sp.]|nr:MAG: DUF2799 domain-containing protein [Desulfobacter sp.]